MQLLESLYEPPIVEQRGEAARASDASNTRNTRYVPVVYYSILVEGRDFSVGSRAGPRATGSGNYCAGPTTAFLTASSVAAPPSATLPLVNSAAWSMTSIETGGASTCVEINQCVG